ncbi:MAG: hypothetical protein HQL98_15595 [Magnetococcales bacterium]|nr:hypothetical protein [Magnetococcales bacterium]
MSLSNHHYTGAGPVEIGPADGSGPIVAVGNTPDLTIAIDDETENLEDFDSAAGGVADSVTRVKSCKLNLAMSVISAANLAIATLGAASVVAAGSVINEEVVAWKGGRLVLQYALPEEASVVVTTKDGSGAGVWEDVTAYVAGSYLKPTVTNGHYYKCVTGGTSGASEPVWPINGATVTDGTVVWRDLGTIIKTAGTDYTVDPLGPVMTPAAAIEDGRPLLVAYSYGAQNVVEAMTQTGREYTVIFRGMNTAKGDRLRAVIFHRVRFTAAKKIDLKTKKFAQLDLVGEVLKSDQGAGRSAYYREIHEEVTG